MDRASGLRLRARICEASAFAGVKDFFRNCREGAWKFASSAIRPSTRFAGLLTTCNRAALDWLDTRILRSRDIALPRDHVFLRTTLADKLRQIGDCGCTHFIDDLPELLSEPAFPATAEKWLFDPNDHHPHDRRFARVTAWAQLEDRLLRSVGSGR